MLRPFLGRVSADAAYSRAVSDFLSWCGDPRVRSIADVQPLNVATWIEMQTREVSAPTAKQRSAATRSSACNGPRGRAPEHTKAIIAKADCVQRAGQLRPRLLQHLGSSTGSSGATLARAAVPIKE